MYVLASKSGILTGKRLARELGLKFHTNADKIRQNSRIIIRYGNAQESPRIAEDTDCNSRNSIIRCSNKHKLHHYLKDSELETPEYFPYKSGIIIPEKLGKVFLGRKREHRAGQDIKLINRGEIIPKATEFLVPLYENIIREYRVHVAFGEVVKVMRKYPINENAHPIIKTTDFGWQYKRSSLERLQCSKSMQETALKTAELLGLTFCGIDMAWSGKEKGLGKWIIWEVNSAPSLNTDSLQLYTKVFKENLSKRS
jgi:glutathione synthase/RimK-type ligase-like ATP-grasp enzyme